MKTTGRLTLFGAFAAAGVGLALCVGMSANAVPPQPAAKSTDLVAVAHVQKEKASPAVELRFSDPKPTVAPETKLLPPSENPTLVAPGLLYAQQAAPAAEKGALPAVVDLLRKGLNGSSPQPSTLEQIPTPRPKTTVDGEGDGKLRIHIYDEDIRKVLDLLSEQGHFNILASKNVEGKVSATLNGVDIDSALQAILKSTGFVSRRDGNYIFVGTPDDFNNIEQGMDRVATRVYRTNYVTANELKTLVAPLLTDKIGIVSISTPAEGGIGTNDSGAGGDKFSGNEVLIVRDYGAVLTQIDQLVSEIDVRPLMVSIEAMILSVKLDDTDTFGVNFQLLRNNPNIKFGLGSPATSLADVKLDGGLKFGFLDGNLGAFINALESVGDTNVIANPRLTVLNKQRAEIQIGEKKGYISQTVTETSSTQSVEFLDIGAQLRLRPFISSDGIIRMEVHPELSDGEVTLEGDFTLPNKRITQVTTNVMVRDGCTVIIGGLIKQQLTNTTTQVPVLGNLPFVGFAFRQTTESEERHEVLVLITPRIVYEPGSCQEGKQGACEFQRRQSTYADKMSPFGKRSIARRYYRLAEAAYAEGNKDRALRLAEMAVHFDPLDRSALELRSNIWAGKPYQPCDAVGMETSPTDLMEGQTMPDWIINDLEKAAPAQLVPQHPLDPGTPGRHTDLVRPKVMQ